MPRPSFALLVFGTSILSAVCVSCSSSSKGSGGTQPTTQTQTNAIVLDEPVAGQALITGTVQTIKWHGGDPAGTVDVWLVPTSGSPLALAQGIPSSGSFDAKIHLLDADLRTGGMLSVAPAGAGPGTSSLGGSALHVEGTGADGGTSAGTPVKVGSLASFAWNGTSEDYFWIDVTTGDQQNVGTVGDLATWSMKTLAVDYDAARIYVIGNDAASTQKVYVMDSKTGALLSSVAIAGAANQSFIGVQLANGGRLIGYSWNGSHEEMSTIDATSGAVTKIGTVGDLTAWSAQTAYDGASDVAYVLGHPGSASGPLTVYSMNASTGALVAEEPVSGTTGDLLGLTVNAKGTLIGFRWNGSQEEMVAVDPSTGDTSVLGTVGDLESWNGIASVNLTTETLYVLGNTSAMTKKLYALDAESGALLYDVDLSLSTLPTQATLVY